MRISLVDAGTGVTAIQPDSGWQITALLEAKNGHLLGIGVPFYPPIFPKTNITGYLVFSDPDQCPSFIQLGPQIETYLDYYCGGTPDPDYPGCVPVYWPDDPLWPGIDPCPPDPGDPAWDAWMDAFTASGLAWPKDETWVEFTPGLSLPDPVPIVSPVGFEEEEPVLWTWQPGWVKRPYGPDLGSVEDDVRYGSWRLLPGLVVLADHGPGVRVVPPGEADTEPAPGAFDRLSPTEAWNLAGFFTSAAYSLKGGHSETSVLAHLNVPRRLFTPVVQLDKHISNPVVDDLGVLCEEGDALYRLDGGPLTCFAGGLTHADVVLNGTVVTVRVFMVDGNAPDVLVDQDWDGDVDIQDALLMGLTPVTTQAATRFTQYHELECDYPYDFDGDGDAGGCVVGARPGGLTRPPR
jgi:hypothetical protein